jgi:hypothetical protein
MMIDGGRIQAGYVTVKQHTALGALFSFPLSCGRASKKADLRQLVNPRKFIT